MPAIAVRPDDGPPEFLRLAGHPVRWRLLKELAASDRAVRELTALLDERQSLVSYHLKELRGAGLVTGRRSSADGRDTYYAVDLDRCGQLLGESAGALHPGLATVTRAPAPAPATPPTRLPPPSPSRRSRRRPSVLFLCTGNGTRSQIAEGLLHEMSGGAVTALSAGSHPKPVHPNAVRVLADRGIDISGATSTHLDRYARRHLDRVVTLCDKVREVCPEMPGHPTTAHWSIPDPGLEGDTDEATFPAFERTADELERRIRFLLPTITER